MGLRGTRWSMDGSTTTGNHSRMRILTWAFFASLSIILMLQLRGLDSDLRLPETPAGIVGYELAWSAARGNEIIDVWKRNSVVETAKVSLGMDFVFLIAYPLMFFTAIRLLRRSPETSFDRLGGWTAVAVLACIPLDATENLLLWQMLDAGATDGRMHLATLAAAAKFLLVLVAALWCLVAIVRRLMGARTARAA